MDEGHDTTGAMIKGYDPRYPMPERYMDEGAVFEPIFYSGPASKMRVVGLCTRSMDPEAPTSNTAAHSSSR